MYFLCEGLGSSCPVLKNMGSSLDQPLFRDTQLDAGDDPSSSRSFILRTKPTLNRTCRDGRVPLADSEWSLNQLMCSACYKVRGAPPSTPLEPVCVFEDLPPSELCEVKFSFLSPSQKNLRTPQINFGTLMWAPNP